MESKWMRSCSTIKFKASITIEAAFAFPIFFFACMALCYLFLFMKAEYTIQRELYYAARDITGYGAVIEPVIDLRDQLWGKAEEGIYGEDSDRKQTADIIQALTALLPDSNGISIKNLVDNVADSLIIGSVVEERIPDNIAKLIEGGTGGLSFKGSELFDREKCLNIVCEYSLKLPLGLLPDVSIPVSHKIRFRYFTGTEVKSLLVEVVEDAEDGQGETEEEEQESEEQVYITESGRRYHYIDKCPALNVKPRKVSFSKVGNERNDGGAKYYACEYCALGKPAQDDCYITPDGDRYHFNEHCQGIKRTIELVPISKVGKRTECKRCSYAKPNHDRE